MALTRKMLKAMGIEDEKIEQIIEAHTEVTDALKKERDAAKEEAALVPEIQKKLEQAQKEAEAATGDEFKAKYDEEHKAFEEYKAQVEADNAAREKTSLYRKLLLDCGVDEKRVDAVIKVTDLNSVEVKDGAIDGADKLTEDIKSEWSAFITTDGIKGANVQTPPAGVDPSKQEPANLADALRMKFENKGD